MGFVRNLLQQECSKNGIWIGLQEYFMSQKKKWPQRVPKFRENRFKTLKIDCPRIYSAVVYLSEGLRLLAPKLNSGTTFCFVFIFLFQILWTWSLLQLFNLHNNYQITISRFWNIARSRGHWFYTGDTTKLEHAKR